MLKTQNKYIRFLANGFLFVSLVFFVDLIAGNALRLLYFKQTSGANFTLTYTIDSTYADVVILGSSHAKHHYIPSVIEDTLGVCCYNYGSGGQNIYYHYGLLGSLLERYTPKIVLVDLITVDYRKTGEEYNTDRLSVLLPYCNRYSAIREVIYLRGLLERVRLLSKIYPYNSQLTSLLISSVKNETKTAVLMSGYSPLHGELMDSLPKIQEGDRFEVDSLKLSYIKKIITICKQNDVRLILLNSPSIVNAIEEPISFNIIENLGKELNVEVWNYQLDKRFLKASYLYDVYHLNDAGAHQFSAVIANRLKTEQPEGILGASKVTCGDSSKIFN